MKKLYLDYAATTPLCEEAFEAMRVCFADNFGNANSQHSFGREAAKTVAEARATVARVLNAEPNEIYFTSCGTESDNWALKGAALARGDAKGRIIVSATEHPAVYHSAEQLRNAGFDVCELPVDGDGLVHAEELEKAITPDTFLVSVMYANNETGAVQPVKRLAEIAHAHGALFHTDAVQAAGALPLDVKALGADMMSLSAHKFYGPKGVGALYVRNGVNLVPLIAGGEQERAKRGGTTDTPAIAGMAAALKRAYDNLDAENARVASVRDAFVAYVESNVQGAVLNGPKDSELRLPNNADFRFGGIDGEALLFALDLAGICASGGSACSSGSKEPSRTLLAMGLSPSEAKGSVRFTFGRHTDVADALYAAEQVANAVKRLRALQ